VPREPLSTRLMSLTPALGAWDIALLDVMRDVSRGHADETYFTAAINHATDSSGVPYTREAGKFAFVMSLLSDIRAASGYVGVVDSQLHVAWPDWQSPDGRRVVQDALVAARTQRLPSRTEVEAVRHLFPGTSSARDVELFLAEGEFSLERADGPSGSTELATAFGVAVGLWSMPYRGREGRSRRFVLTGRHRTFGGERVIVGILEVGDDAPYGALRDRFLGLTTDGAHSWLRRSSEAKRADLERRLAQLRGAVLPVAGVEATVESLLADAPRLLQRASGRSLSGDDLETKKRIAYLVRLARGERGVRAIRSGRDDEEAVRDLSHGVRALHNLTLPKVHLEVTLCGAVPPFTSGLAGKLVTSFFAHPQIRDAVVGPPGALVQQVMKAEDYLAVIPNHGVLAITTKGLYPGHSALYNRASIPGADTDLKLRKLGSTKGHTTTLLSERTARLAQRLSDGDEGAVSRVYGTGGAKRQRALESAAVACGLPESLVHAGIRRPMYGVALATNLPDVVWAGRSPHWAVPLSQSHDDYAASAVEQWRERWLSAASRRLREGPSTIPGTIECLVDSAPYGTDEPTPALSVGHQDI
jgi:hypothetical protein